MFEKLKTLLKDMSPIEYGIANLTAMLTVPITAIILRLILRH